MDPTVDQARFNMIQQQIRPWEVVDERVLSVMYDTPRESFVPDAYRSLAYADIDIPIGHDQAMLAPKVVGRMLQALAIRPGDTILEIGAGTGYVTACLARLGGRVLAIEIEPDLAQQARDNLRALGLDRVEIEVGDGLAGLAPGGPYDAIAVTGSMPTDEPLEMLRGQLAGGGRVCAFVGEAPIMDAVLITRIGGSGIRREALFETCVPALRNVPQPERFVF